MKPNRYNISKKYFALEGIKTTDFISSSDLWLGLFASTLLINILSVLFPLAALQVYDRIIPNKSLDTLSIICFSLVLIYIIEMLIKIARAYIAIWADTRLTFKANLHTVKHLLLANLIEEEKEGPGVYLERLNNFDAMRDFYGGNLIILLLDIPFLLVFLFLIYYIGGILVLIPIILQSTLILLVLSKNSKTHKILNKKSTLNKVKLNFIVEILSSISTVKSLAIEEQILSRYEKLQNKCILEDHTLSLQQAATTRIVSIFSQVNLIFVAGFGTILILNNMLTIGGLAACTLLASRSIQPLNRALNFWNKLQNIKIAKEGRDKILELPLEQTEFKADKLDIVGKIEFKDVAISNLKNINFTVKPKEFIVIQGTSSNLSDRKLLLNAITKLSDIKSGEILIDGQDINLLNSIALRKHIGVLPEKTHLFGGSILENITCFRGGEYEQKAKQIAKEIGLESIIVAMPDGYNTKISANTSLMISQGFKQGILAARVLIDDPKIIIFDEANSTMDINSDQKFMQYFKTLIGKKTIIMISNRPSTYKLATKTYRIE